jgi:hypothetical protein
MRSLISRTMMFLAGGAAVLLLLELLLRLMPVIDGAYAADPGGRWPIRTLVPNSDYTYSIGWNATNIHHGHINNLGYVSPFDYHEGSSGIVVIGDSYVESMMNDYDETLQGQLARDLRSPQQVMSFGMSGADLPHYLGTAELLGRHFDPTWGIVLVTASDYSGGFSADSGYYRWAPERDPPIELVPEFERSSMTKFLRGLALTRYLRGNLMIRVNDLIQLHRAEGGNDEHRCEHRTLPREDEQLTAKFIDALPRALGLPPERVILVFDSDRKALYPGTPAAPAVCPNVDQLARDRIMQLASVGGLHVIDSGPIFREYYASTYERLDFTPQDGHWNPTAHRLIAGAVADVINEAPPSKGVHLSGRFRPGL